MSEKEEYKPGGRPTKYKDEYAEMAYNYCSLGAIDDQLASFFGVCRKTIDSWKKEYSEFLYAINAGKEIANGTVIMSAFKRANGFEAKEEKINYVTTTNESGELVEVAKERTVTTKMIAPDTQAFRFWLMNRDPENWRDRKDVQIGGAINILIDEEDKGVL